MKKNTHLTITDQFCGAGGSSQGARNVATRIKGIEIKLALNHWKLAIETHQTNFPETSHDCTDISACDPRRYPSTDILITSPECKTHTPAGGNNHKKLKQQMDIFNNNIIDPATERSRATMWDVCRFAEYHQYNIIIVENVVEAKTTWPLFDTWLTAMHVLGYNHKCIYANSQFFYPTPQSRDRMYIVFWKKGNKAPKLEFTPKAYCDNCTKDVQAIQHFKRASTNWGKYNKQYTYNCPSCGNILQPYYFAAFNCIDWSDKGTRISDRKKPLSENTITRIKYGLNKYGEETFLVNGQQSTGVSYRVRSAMQSCSSIPTQPHYKLIMPFLFKTENASLLDQSKLVSEAFQAQLTRQSAALLTPPMIIDSNYDPKPSRAAAATKEMCTQNTHARTGLLQMPIIIENKGTSTARKIEKPLSGVTCVPYHGILTNEAWNSFIAYNYAGTQTSHITEPTDGVNCRHRMSLIQYEKPAMEDCFYRMLKPHEIKLAMAFDTGYKVLGSGKDQVKQLGNAVTPPVMEWLVERCVESLK